MPRIQVLRLPAEIAGGFSATPFVLVVDDLGHEDPVSSLFDDAAVDGIKAATGARGILCFESRMDVA